MKKIGLITIVIVLLLFSTIGVSAEQTMGNIYQIKDVTIIFDSNSQLSVEQQAKIAQLLANPENGVAPANLICNIFGHKNQTEGVSTITHKVSATSPRCLEEMFTITICSRCDETTVERNAYYYITCCPED